MKQALLFDFFGTLVNYQDSISNLSFRSTFDVLQSLGFAGSYKTFLDKWNATEEALIEKSLDTFCEYHLYDAAARFMSSCDIHPSRGEIERFVHTLLTEWNSGVVYKDGVGELLRDLSRDYELAIVSNTNYAPLVEGHLKAMNVWSLFKLVITSVEFGYRKPHRSIFDTALRRMNIKPEAALYIGDNYKDDYCGAQSAGIRCLLIDPDKRYPIDVADRIHSLFELRSLLARGIID